MMWPGFYIARLEAEEVDRRAWLEDLAWKYGIVRLAASLSAEEWDRQHQWIEFRLGRRFLTTTPLPGLVMGWDGIWRRTEPR
jgi:hypothetical protein